MWSIPTFLYSIFQWTGRDPREQTKISHSDRPINHILVIITYAGGFAPVKWSSDLIPPRKVRSSRYITCKLVDGHGLSDIETISLQNMPFESLV
jgi:hypothetical protein